MRPRLHGPMVLGVDCASVADPCGLIHKFSRQKNLTESKVDCGALGRLKADHESVPNATNVPDDSFANLQGRAPASQARRSRVERKCRRDCGDSRAGDGRRPSREPGYGSSSDRSSSRGTVEGILHRPAPAGEAHRYSGAAHSLCGNCVVIFYASLASPLILQVPNMAARRI